MTFHYLFYGFEITENEYEFGIMIVKYYFKKEKIL